MSSTTKYIPQLDGVRAIAALMVMYFHFFQTFPIGRGTIANIIQKTSVIGQTGVSLFFVLSGFLITRILLSTKDETHYFKNFYMKRVLRIFPLYYLFLILSYFLFSPLINGNIPPLKDQLVFYSYLQNFYMTFSTAIGPGHFWSLAVEEHFYLMWPLIVFYIDTRKLIYALIGLIGLSVITRIVLVSMNYEVFYFTFTRLDDICVGSLFAVLYLVKGENITIFQGRKFIYVLSVFAFIVFSLWLLTTGSGNRIMQVVKFLFIAFAYFMTLGYSIYNNNYAVRLLQNRVIVYLGKISYGLYVYHPICYYFTHRYLNTNTIVFNLIVSFSISIIIAAFSFHFFERIFLKYKKRYH